MKKTYVLLYIFNEDNSQIVGLLKKRGPPHLIGKITVPGGKSEQGEDIYEAATREAKEECDLNISHWKLFDSTITDHYDYHKLYSTGNDISQAQQMEDEPIFIMDVAEHMEQCSRVPEAYTLDFSEHMQKLSSLLGFSHDLKAA